MKAFIVNSKDLLDRKKNPKLSLSPREILKNKKIKQVLAVAPAPLSQRRKGAEAIC